MKISLFVGTLMASLVVKAEVGFKSGNNFTAILSRGNITVQCPMSGNVGGPTTAMFRCQEDILQDGEYDYFVGPERVQADEVTLTATHENGSTRSKQVGYDSAKGQSTKPINLWIATLLQKPLLDVGVNKVAYVITYKGKVTARGEFVATVRDGGVKTCSRRGYYWSNSSMDCQDGFHYCSVFFRENNYCL